MVPNGHLIFEDDSFLDSTVAKMNALRKSGQFCDVRMQVCGRELMAHRAVLACCSPFLFELFNSECELQGGVSLVRFDDLDPDAMEILLNYAYTAQLKADKDLVREVYSAARKLKMERVRQVCGDYLLSKIDSQSAISYRKFASSMADARLLAQVDTYIQEHLLDVANHDDFLKLPRLKLEVVLEDSLVFPGNGRLYSKVIDWVQCCLWENGQPMESLMDQVQTLYYSADHRLHPDHSPTQITPQQAPPEGLQRQSSIGSAPGGQLCKYEWKYIASEKTTISTYLCLAVLNGMLCVISLNGRSSPLTTPSAIPADTPSLSRSLSLEATPSEGAERVLQPMHYARSGLGTASLGGKLIAAGGYNREECLRTVECYNPKTDSWSFLSPMRTPRARFQMAVLMDQLYVMGGSNGQSDELSCGETYDPLADEWTQVPELRTNRCNAGVCALKGRLFVVGGSDPCGQTGLKNCDSFDPVNKTWSPCAPLNIRRHQAAVCELGGVMYAIGGAESWNCLSSVERYDPDEDGWTPVAPMNQARRGAGMAVHEGRLVVVGGFDGSHALSSVEVYDPATDAWRMLGGMTSARSNAGVAVLGGVVCAVGGFDGNDFMNTMEVYEPETNEWSPCGHAFSLDQ